METQMRNKEIMENLIKLQAQINKLQEDFEDSILTQEDIEAIKLADKEYKEGKLVSLEDIEKLRKKNVSN